MARVSDTLLHGGGDARHSWPGSTLARNPTQVTQVSNHTLRALSFTHEFFQNLGERCNLVIMSIVDSSARPSIVHFADLVASKDVVACEISIIGCAARPSNVILIGLQPIKTRAE